MRQRWRGAAEVKEPQGWPATPEAGGHLGQVPCHDLLGRSSPCPHPASRARGLRFRLPKPGLLGLIVAASGHLPRTQALLGRLPHCPLPPAPCPQSNPSASPSRSLHQATAGASFPSTPGFPGVWHFSFLPPLDENI